MTKETVGKISSDLIIDQVDDTHSAHEQMQEQLTDWDRELETCVKSCLNAYPIGDFYVVVITKKEKLMQNVLRNYFYGRYSCPTPDWDQVVYKYHRADNRIEFLWVVPCKEVCETMKRFPLDVPKEEHELRDFVLAFEDGTLLKKSKLLNGEKADGLIILE